MSDKIKVGNAEVEKANYDYFSLIYEKMPKEYVVADLVSKCEDYDKLYKNYEMKDLQIEEIRKELINQDKYISKLKEEYANQLQEKENIIKEAREYIMTELITEWDIKNDGYVSGSDLPAYAITPILEILDKEDKQ